MSGEELALALGGLATFVTALVTALRSYRSDRTTESERQTASAMETQGDLIKRLENEIARLTAAFEKERKVWWEERAELKAEIRRLEVRVRELER